MCRRQLSLHSLPHELWVQPSVPKLRPLSWKLKNTRHICQVSDSPAPSSPGWARPQEELSAMWQPDLPLPPPNHSLLLGPLSGHDFQNFQDELSMVWHKGLGARARAPPEPAERAPLDPAGKQDCSCSGSPHSRGLWSRVLFSLQSVPLLLFLPVPQSWGLGRWHCCHPYWMPVTRRSGC